LSTRTDPEAATVESGVDPVRAGRRASVLHDVLPMHAPSSDPPTDSRTPHDNTPPLTPIARSRAAISDVLVVIAVVVVALLALVAITPIHLGIHGY